MYLEGTYNDNNMQFNKILWGPTTGHYITRAKEMDERRWAEVFRCLNSVLARKRRAEHANHGGPPPSDTRLPVPDSDSDGDFPEPEDEANGNNGMPDFWRAVLLTDLAFSVMARPHLSDYVPNSTSHFPIQ